MEMRILKTLQWRLNFAIPGEISRFLLNECVLNLNESIFEQIDEFINYTLTSILNDFLKILVVF